MVDSSDLKYTDATQQGFIGSGASIVTLV
jgi:hypothetical protein